METISNVVWGLIPIIPKCSHTIFQLRSPHCNLWYPRGKGTLCCHPSQCEIRGVNPIVYSLPMLQALFSAWRKEPSGYFLLKTYVSCHMLREMCPELSEVELNAPLWFPQHHTFNVNEITTANIIEHFICSRHYVQYFTWIILLNPCHKIPW